jgi:hypothetical protein
MSQPINAAMDVDSLFEQSLIVVDGLDSLPVDRIRSTLDTHDFACIRGIFTRQETRDALGRLRARFDPANDRKHDPRDATALHRNFQKVVVGGTAGPNSVPRLLRMFYNPFMADDIYGMHDQFLRLTRFRNILYDLPRDFTCGGIEEGMWTAARINHYPRGGGFMACHVDSGTDIIARSAGLTRYLQIIWLLTEKGTDFHTGGAYIGKHGQRYFLEDRCKSGDVFIYDGRIQHGVEEVDGMEPFDMRTFEGRHAAFVTLFRDLSGKESEYTLITGEGRKLEADSEPQAARASGP